MAPARWYVANKSTFWMPTFPELEKRIDISPSNPLLWALRLARLYWSLVLTLPLHVFLVLLTTAFPSIWVPISVAGRERRSWTTRQRIFYPLISRFVWSVAGTGGTPGDISAEMERTVPLSSRWVEWAGGWLGAEEVAVWVDDVVPLEGEEALEWIRDEALDPRGEVQRVVVPCFWLELQSKGGEKRKARAGERVILFLVGGGYVSGSPVEGSRSYDLARETGLRVVGVNYRKATNDRNAFPAGLQDALTAYMHLVLDLGYRDVVLAGDSAGAGLCNTLLFYLTTTLALSAHPPATLVLPSALVLYSPWCDLTLSALLPTVPHRFADDFLNLTMINYAANGYLVNLARRPSDKPCLGLTADEFNGSPWDLRARHPFVSPALEGARPMLKDIDGLYRSKGRRLPFLVISGTAEMFAPEIGWFVENLELAKGEGGASSKEGLTVEWFEEEDEVHVFMMVPRWLSPASGRMLKKVVEFLEVH